ncbi:restriction endonuclease subunit S [Citrobacter freundii]|nr:restriction endonuclease subunit S [Citrobacter freundii]MDT7309187.1 restriction endonuclease subunit S [Citrobacter freundii]
MEQVEVGKYQPYPEYKDSGVEWVGDMPHHWQTKPAFAAVMDQCIKNSDGAESNVLSLSYGNIVERDVENNFGLLPESFNTYQIVNPGDIVLRLTDLQNDKRSLRVARSTLRGIITSAYLKLACGDELDNRYAYRLLHSYDTTKVFYGMGGGLRQSMKFEDFRRLPFLLPPVEEQRTIAAFLDYETARIDKLIAQQQRLIELLKEKRQAVISHAVTKGLNPDAPMKDSGVEWLGEVPEHWGVMKVAYALKIDNNLRTPIDRNIRSEKVGDYPYYGPTGILDYIDEFFAKGEYFLLGEDGDHFLKFSQKPMTILVNGEFSVNNHAHLLKGYKHCSTAWGALFFETKDLFPWLIRQGVGRYKLRKESLVTIPMVIPPTDEQKEILKIINKVKIDINSAIEKSESFITLLQERRTALISAAVTGKIDLRGWTQPGEVAA